MKGLDNFLLTLCFWGFFFNVLLEVQIYLFETVTERIFYGIFFSSFAPDDSSSPSTYNMRRSPVGKA